MPYTWRSIVWPLALGSSPVLWLLGHRMRGSHTGKSSSRQLTVLTYQNRTQIRSNRDSFGIRKWNLLDSYFNIHRLRSCPANVSRALHLMFPC